jgi:hypothetical protein
VIELPTPLDLPEGTEVIVKVQWPFEKKGARVMVYAKDMRHIRLIQAEDLPSWLYGQFNPGHMVYAWAVVKNQEWEFVMSAPTQDW